MSGGGCWRPGGLLCTGGEGGFPGQVMDICKKDGIHSFKKGLQSHLHMVIGAS